MTGRVMQKKTVISEEQLFRTQMPPMWNWCCGWGDVTPISSLLLCDRLFQSNGLKKPTVTYLRALTVSMGQGFGSAWLGDLGSGCHHLSRTGAGGPVSKVTHSRGWQAGAGSRQEAAVAVRVGLATGLLECPHNMAADFHKREQLKRRQKQYFL